MLYSTSYRFRLNVYPCQHTSYYYMWWVFIHTFKLFLCILYIYDTTQHSTKLYRALSFDYSSRIVSDGWCDMRLNAKWLYRTCELFKIITSICLPECKKLNSSTFTLHSLFFPSLIMSLIFAISSLLYKLSIELL